jgi:hypothetical protein
MFTVDCDIWLNKAEANVSVLMEPDTLHALSVTVAEFTLNTNDEPEAIGVNAVVHETFVIAIIELDCAV